MSWKSIKCGCHRVGDRYLALTSRYSVAIYILTTRFCLVLLIVKSDKLAFLTDIWNFKASSRFCKRWENFASQMKILKKGHFLTTPPLKNGLVQEILHLGNLCRTKYAVKVRRHTPWSRGPLSWIPWMLVHASSISFATVQSSHNSEIYNIGVHAQ